MPEELEDNTVPGSDDTDSEQEAVVRDLLHYQTKSFLDFLNSCFFVKFKSTID